MVTCRSCGFLAHQPLARLTGGPNMEEVPERIRSSLNGAHVIAWAPGPGVKDWDAELVCLRRSPSFPSSALSRDGLLNQVGEAERELAAERECDLWYRYQQGWSPQRHLENQSMLDWHAMEQRANDRATQMVVSITWRVALVQVIATFLVTFLVGLLVAYLTATQGSRIYGWWPPRSTPEKAAPPTPAPPQNDLLLMRPSTRAHSRQGR